MAKYTVELNQLLNSGFDIGLNTYPIFDETYRDKLNTKIKNHFYFYEIGMETPAKFKFFLNNKMNEIMPYYNKLFQSELLVINPLLSFERKTDNVKDTDNTIVINNDTTQNTTNEIIKDNIGNNTITDKDLFNDTPRGLIDLASIETNVYASSYDIKNNTNVIDENETTNVNEDITINNDNTTTGTTKETTVITENGFEVPLADLLLKYRETFLNIDMQIINDLKDCFMLVF